MIVRGDGCYLQGVRGKRHANQEDDLHNGQNWLKYG